ncbi:DUF4832 domain-containing protein [Mariniblastus fucicola]|uniref:DUF4832 domain-containing protein n=1 Tax=Mariniblastus fucicola TaxID=980251 RepID=A0A5B9PKT2_9BACT|nr:DUF4832 domain-containing protein [Mariniblastus fucicola]QEG23003.1 hypothetical protein MFFC18_28950 [Mariniblastus fucicola]
MKFRSAALLLVSFLLFASASVSAQKPTYKYRPAPIDNPLRGLVPYVSAMPWLDPYATEDEKQQYLKKFQSEVFPHSMEFHYFSMRELMPEKGRVDFAPIERWLYQANGRGCQLTFRVYLEYPTKKSPSVPQFLIDGGLKITKWKNEDKELIHAPDYEDPELRAAIDLLIAKLGEKYDGDPRVACLTMGILGHWGEWHSYPRTELFPDKAYQTHVMDQFAEAFKTTPVLLRYPAGEHNYTYASNAKTKFGYHDDSFAWATVDTGKEEDDWFFVPALKTAGVLDAWKMRMIGGEIRPEVWGCVFDDESCEVKGQEFVRCVEATHASWLMDSGMFGEKGKPSAERVRNATRKVGRLGYSLHVPSVTIRSIAGKTKVDVSLENRGVAPFYFDWPVEVAVLDDAGKVVRSVEKRWKLPSILPGESVTREATFESKLTDGQTIAIRIPNPLPEGKPLRFANENQQLDGEGWLILN